MLIYGNAEEIDGQRKFDNTCVENDTPQTCRQGFNKLKSRTKVTNETEEKTC